MKKPTLSKTMTLKDFDNGYWYAKDLKEFGLQLGIPSSSKLRKDQLEDEIKHFIKTGRIRPNSSSPKKSTRIKDIEKKLTGATEIKNYTNNRQTKDFLVKEAKRLFPQFSQRSGCWYRLNRWREEQLNSGHKITYGDLAGQLVELCKPEKKYERIPHGRYINFLADFLKNEPQATRAEALKSWEELKETDIPKTYKAWATRKRK